MRRTILSTFAAAALLSPAAGGGAIDKTGSSFPLSSEQLHAESIGRIAALPEPASAHRRVKTAQIVFDHSGLIVSPIAGKDSKKGFSGNRQGGGAAAPERGGRPVNPSTQVNVTSGTIKGGKKAKTGKTMRQRARPARRGPGEFVVPSLVR